VERSGGETRWIEISYAPLPSQRKFHNSLARFKGFSGPIGSGKSQALCQEAIRLSYINAGRQGLIGAPTYPMLRDATLTSFLEVLAHNKIQYALNKSELVLRMKDTGSRIYFRSVDDFERLRGTNLAWFGLDELTYTAEESWLRLQGRLRDPLAKRLCGFAVWTPKGFDWVYRKFIQDRAGGYEVVLAKL
jgi:phage terminase large subunit